MNRVLNSWWHRFQVARAGKRDGKARIPRADDTRSAEFEGQIVQQGHQILSGFQEVRAKKGARLLAAQDDAIGRAKRVVGQFKAKYHEYDARKRALGRGVIVHLGWGKYLALMVAIAIGELALNFQAFQVFQKPLYLTLLMSLVVAVGLPTSAHFIGVFLKQWPSPAWRTAVYVTLSFAVGVVCLNGINIARAQYLVTPGELITGRDAVLQKAFFYINLFVFCMAILASYFAHDADQDFDNMRRAFFALDRQCGAARARLTAVVKDLNTIQQTHEAKVAGLAGIVRELAFLYRRHNRHQRDDDPVAFKTDPNLPVDGDTPLPIVTPDQIDELFKDWSQVDETPQRKQAAEASASHQSV